MTDPRHRTRRRPLARLVFNSRYAGPTLDRAFAAPDELIDASGHVLKHDRTTTVTRIAEGGTVWVIKRYNTKNTWHAVRRALRTSRASNCWRMSEMFLAAGITVPSPVGYIENRIGPLRGRSYFLYEFVDAQDLLGFVRTCSDPAESDFVFEGIRDLFRALRQSGINHGDMKATNILVAPDLSLRLLDLDAARRPERRDLFEQGDARDLLGFVRTCSDPAEWDFVFDGIRDLFRALRQSGINHGDMKATNILVAPDLSLRLLDLDAARRPERRDLFEQGYARDRARFLKNWDADPDLRDRFGSELPA